jgi:hypothetical protein
LMQVNDSLRQAMDSGLHFSTHPTKESTP